MSAANSVRELRKNSGLTQAELAARSGVAQPNIAAYESGRRTPSVEMLSRLQDASQPLPRDVLRAHRDELISMAADHGLRNVRVFGSASRGEDGPTSDLDLLVSRDEGVSLFDVIGFEEAVHEAFGIRADVVTDGGLRAGHKILLTAVPL